MEEDNQGKINIDEDLVKKIDNILEYVKKQIIREEVYIEEVKKFTPIQARQGKVGEQVATIMEDGFVEQEKNTVKIDPKTGNPGQYIPKGKPVLAIRIDETIQFANHWGEEMIIRKGGYLLLNSPEKIYGVQSEAFNNTYKNTGKDFELARTEAKMLLEVNIENESSTSRAKKEACKSISPEEERLRQDMMRYVKKSMREELKFEPQKEKSPEEIALENRMLQYVRNSNRKDEGR